MLVAVRACQAVEIAHKGLQSQLESAGHRSEARDHKDPNDDRRRQQNARYDQCGEEARIDLKSEKADLIRFVQDAVLHGLGDGLLAFPRAAHKDQPCNDCDEKNSGNRQDADAPPLFRNLILIHKKTSFSTEIPLFGQDSCLSPK